MKVPSQVPSKRDCVIYAGRRLVCPKKSLTFRQCWLLLLVVSSVDRAIELDGCGNSEQLRWWGGMVCRSIRILLCWPLRVPRCVRLQCSNRTTWYRSGPRPTTARDTPIKLNNKIYRLNLNLNTILFASRTYQQSYQLGHPKGTDSKSLLLITVVYSTSLFNILSSYQLLW